MKHRKIGALLLAVPLSAVGVSVSARGPETAHANSAPPYWEGSDGMGAILAGDQCPVEVEKEHLRFTLGELPTALFVDDAEAFKNYSGKFTAEYTFYNPTEEDVDLHLVFPLGILPEYYPFNTLREDDRASLGYAIKQGDKDVPFTVRHTFNDAWYDRVDSFDLEGGLKRLYPEENKFYRDDLPVTVYNYRIEAAPKGTDLFEFVNFSLFFSGSAERTRVLCSEHCAFSVKDGKAKLNCGFDCVNDSPLRLSVYVLGEDITDREADVFRYERGVYTSLSDAKIELESHETTTFADFLQGTAMQQLREKSGLSASDWRNALINAIESNRFLKTCCSEISPKDLGDPLAYMQWFEYSLSIPAKGKTVNSVTAPIYPTVDGGRTQDLYYYNYLLSPAQKWANFGELIVDIDTPFYLSDSSLNFEKREGGYSLTRAKLPLGELTFTLSEEERTSGGASLTQQDDPSLITAIVILCVTVAGVGIVVAILAVQSNKKKKRRQEEERRLMQARPQEGKIDLPDEPAEDLSGEADSSSGQHDDPSS